MKLPGVAWTALALALTAALGGWLKEFVSEPWVPMVVLVLNFIGSAVQTYFDSKKQQELAGATSKELFAEPVKERSFASKVFLGQ